jgi:SAM-dependent methyltransferase
MSLDGRMWRVLRRVDDASEFDRNFGTDTGASLVQSEGLDIAGPNWIHGIRYSPTPAAKLHEMLAALPIRHEDFSFVDFGSGKGKVLLLASELPFRAIIGIEFSEHLHEVARRNLASYRSETQACKKIDCLLVDATVYEVPPEPVVCYFYNPFREPVMEQVVRRLEDSLQAAPRQVFVLYYRPEFQSFFARSKYFREFRADRDFVIYQSLAGGV